MPGWDLLLPFAVGTLLVAYYPGPALLYTAAQTLVRGRRAGLLATAGIHLGGYAHVVAAALGFSALFRHVPTWSGSRSGCCAAAARQNTRRRAPHRPDPPNALLHKASRSSC